MYEIPQFGNVHVREDITFKLCEEDVQSVKRLLALTRMISSIYIELKDYTHLQKKMIFEAIIEVLAHNCTPNNSLELCTLTVEDFEYLMSLLVKWNSKLRLVTLSLYRGETPFCHQPERCAEFCTVFSCFLAENVSLKKINMVMPFRDIYRCIDIIRSGLKQNSTLDELIICKKVIFRRNCDTSIHELVQGLELIQAAQQFDVNSYIVTSVSQRLKRPLLLGASNVETIQTPSPSKALSCSSFDVLSQVRQVPKLDNSRESLHRPYQHHVEPQLSRFPYTTVSFQPHSGVVIHFQTSQAPQDGSFSV